MNRLFWWRRWFLGRGGVALLAALAASSFASTLHAQTSCDTGTSALDPTPPKGTTPAEIVQKFAAKETIFKQARESYSYTLEVTVQTVLDSKIVDGEFRRIWDITYDGRGKRQETTTFSPHSTLTRVNMTQEDFDDLRNHPAFQLTSDELPQYDVLYAGQQHIDEIDAYVFNVAPKHLEKGRRYFQGQVWVDARDFLIVKTCGKDVSSRSGNDLRKRTLTLVTYREQIDGQYWFPTYSRADEVLHFATADIHVREIIKYTKYRAQAPRAKSGQDAASSPATPGNTKEKRN